MLPPQFAMADGGSDSAAMPPAWLATTQLKAGDSFEVARLRLIKRDWKPVRMHMHANDHGRFHRYRMDALSQQPVAQRVQLRRDGVVYSSFPLAYFSVKLNFVQRNYSALIPMPKIAPPRQSTFFEGHTMKISGNSRATMIGNPRQQGSGLPDYEGKLELKTVIHPDEIRDNLPKHQGGIGFLFHATDWETLSFSYHNVKERNPEFENELWGAEPFIASPIYLGDQLIGANIACPVPLELWLGRSSGIKRFRETQFFPALALAKRAGLNMVAMGASTPYACNYGMLPRDLHLPHITTGHAATAAMLKEWAMHCCQAVSLNFHDSKIALFGAAGRLGTTVAKFLSYKDTPRELVLIDLPDKISLLKKQAAELLMSEFPGKLTISVYTFNPDTPLPKFDGAILTSCTSTPYLTADDLNRAKFWIDDSHPRAASVEAEIASRNNTLYIECFARGPEGLDTGFPFRLPSRQDCYTCFAEGYAAWQEGINSDFIVGSPPVWSVGYTHNLLKKYGFSVGPFFGKNGSEIPSMSGGLMASSSSWE